MKNGLTELRRLLRMRPRTKAPFIYPAREWALGLLVGMCIFVAGIVHGSVLFMTASNETEAEITVTTEQQELPYDERKVRAVLETYEARARVFEQMRGMRIVSTTTPAVEDEAAEVPEAPAGGSPVAE